MESLLQLQSMMDIYDYFYIYLDSSGLLMKEIFIKYFQKSAKKLLVRGLWIFLESQKEMEKMAENVTFFQRYLKEHIVDGVIEHRFGVSIVRQVDPYEK